MFFDVKQFSLKRNGRFAKCWLAATCPKQFHKFVNRAEVDDIRITILCDSILKKSLHSRTHSGTLEQQSERLPLQLAAQLTFGTVCIHKQQVDSFYEHISKSLCIKSCFESIKRKKHSGNYHKPNKRPRVIASVVSRLISDFHDSVFKDVDTLDQSHDEHSAHMNAVTLREVISEHIDTDAMEGFDVLTEAERMDFLYGELSPNERSRCIAQEAGMLIVVAEAHGEPPDEEILCSQKTVYDDNSVPVYSYRSAARTNDADAMCSYSVIPKMENIDMVEDEPAKDPAGGTHICTTLPTIESRPKRKLLLIDAIKSIPNSDMFDPFRYDSSKRCSSALDEVPDISDVCDSMWIRGKRNPITHKLWMGTKPLPRMLQIGEQTQMSARLTTQFQRRKATGYTEATDEEWVLRLCGELPEPNDCREREILHNEHEPPKSSFLMMEPMEDKTISNEEVTITGSNVPDIILRSLGLAPWSIKHEADLSPFVNVATQLGTLLQSLNLNEYPVEITNGLDADMLQTYREIHEMWGLKGILEKLIHLWRLHIEPIDMNMLLRGAVNGATRRRCAAVVFYTLLDLNKIGFIQLHKSDYFNRIRHISKTDKLNELLNELYI